MRIMFKKSVPTLALLLLLSCINEKIEDENPIPTNGKEINLSVNVPRSGISTYAEDGSIDENHIDTVFVKIFEDNVLKGTKKFFGSDLQQVGASVNDSIVNIAFEMDDLAGGAITVDVFANSMEITPITGELPIPKKANPETCFMMSGSGALTNSGGSYSGTIHLTRSVAKLRVIINKHPLCIPSDLIIDYSDIVIEVQQAPDRVQLMAPPPISTPAGLNYINYAPRTGSALRPKIPFASFTGGQIDSLYLYENYLDNSAYTSANITKVKITLASHTPSAPVTTSEYTFQLNSGGSNQLKRNYIYTLDIKVAGQSLEPFVTLDIQPWEDVNIDGDIYGADLSLEKSTIALKPVSTGSIAGSTGYKTDNQSISLDWSRVKPAHNINTSATYIQGTDGNIEIFWTNDGAPDFDFKDTLYITAGNIMKAVILDYKSPKGSSGNWVGTFHRWNQQGERIVKMPNKGEWIATVTSGTGFIVLDKTETTDANWGTSTAALGNDAGFETGYPVNSTATTVSGVGLVYFRVGMKSTLADAAAPPRYGIIEIATSNGLKKIYVRQGESADYLMRTEDLNPSNSNRTRSNVVQLSPFNLADPSHGTGGGSVSAHNNMPYGESTFDSDKFTDYPSQGGYLFQWNLGGGSIHKALHPVNAITAISGWESTAKSGWSGVMEPCPKGYRHPNDMLQSPASSEIRQSLYAIPDIGTHTTPPVAQLSNSQWGYYADGLFDRRAIVTSPTGADSTTVSFNSSNIASAENTGIAYSGLLVYNPATNASLFFPAAGERRNVNGVLGNTGAVGSYWTSTGNGNNGLTYILSPSSFYINNTIHQSNGLSVRCVRGDYGLPGSL